MSSSTDSPASQLPGYIACATPNPAANRAPWYKNTAPTYAGIFLWFVFWTGATNSPTLGGVLSHGVGWALASLVIAALVCHFLFYLAPGMLGMKTGLPLYIVGSSTFGAKGGFILPGFLMGLLQFGWLGVNVYFSSLALAQVITVVPPEVIMVVWGVLAAFVGLKGIQYVAKVATFLPLIPAAVLIILLIKTLGGLGSFDPTKFVELHKSAVPAAPEALSAFGVLAFMLTYVVGFFATAGAAGADFGTSSRGKSDVQMGGLIGVAAAIIITAGASILIVAGAYGTPEYAKVAASDKGVILQSTGLIPAIMGDKTAGIMMFLLAIAAFPSACFSSLIAANSFKTTLPKVNPFISVGVGAGISILLAVTGWAGKAIIVFEIIGASFGPICGAMLVEYLLNGGKWSGPRAGFNPAGWIAWAIGFCVGVLPTIKKILLESKGYEDIAQQIPNIPAAPVVAFLVGAVVFFLCAKAGLQSAVLPMPEKK